MRAASEFSVNQSFIKANRVGPPAWMRGVGRDLNRILVTLMVILEDERRNLSLLNKTLRSAATEIDDSGETRAGGDVCHVEHVVDLVEDEVVLLFETRGGNSNGDAAIGDGRTDRSGRELCMPR